ncbi:chromosome segregation SMC family protein [Paraferrimonas sedimenticola]|uniref:Chromosome partition protein Smc n=1 Tax=Paraferrimonas sedimenticola TaxID=375674 RepID=A0AA37RS78_9GAMM|nr:AAA family ATPase [Paraferrimonas sedimenticola]GLP94744.1 chromosome partition protein Smc [Paraferrimonas sedimenticola]
MRLKQIKLAGFKSFVDPTKIALPKAITAIVGPNGCGKSNVIDAVRWVLGESSAKHLRGDAMTDVIFNGSNSRKPVGQASVELVFEQCDSRLTAEYAQYNEISVKRVVNREAQSQYWLNGKKCRRRDVTDLFMGTGLGPRSYAIIEQGTIARLIESKPAELRVFIEEAAAISKYKERRRETENRIRHTRENLDRLSDIRLELGNQLSRLQRQADAAKRYRNYKQQQGQLKAQLAAWLWRDAETERQALDAKIDELKTQREAISAEQVKRNLSLQQLQSQTEAQRSAEQEHTQKAFVLSKQANQLEQQIRSQEQSSQHRQEQLAAAKQTLEQAVAQQTQLEAQATGLQSTLAELEPELALAQALLEERQAQLADAKEHNDLILAKQAKYQGMLSQAHQHLAKSQTEQASAKAKQNALQQRLQELSEALEEQADSQLETQAEELTQALAQNQAAIDLQQQVAEEAQFALEAAQQALADDEASTRDALKRESQLQGELAAVKAQLASLETQAETSVYQVLDAPKLWQKALGQLMAPIMLQPVQVFADGESTESGFSDDQSFELTLDDGSRIQAPINLQPWLDGIRFAKDEAQAEALMTGLKPQQAILLADGQLWGQGFKLTPAQTTHALSLESQSQTLDAELSTNSQRLAQLRQSNERQLETVHIRHNQAKQAQTEAQSLNQQHQRIELQREHVQSQLVQLTEQQQKAQLKYSQAEQELQQLSAALAPLDAQMAEAQAQQQSAQAQLEQLGLEVEQTREHWQTLQSQALEAERQQLGLSHQQQSTQQQIAALQPSLGQARQQAQQAQARIDELSKTSDAPVDMAALQSQLQSLLSAQSDAQKAAESARQQSFEASQSQQQMVAEQAKANQSLQQIAESQHNIELAQQQKLSDAQHQLEQLGEGVDANQLSLLLEGIDEIATEQSLRSQLSQVALKIERLGAINLAAVEEFDQANQRKVYLDEQDLDLNKALEALEQAIRTIDKETRQKFKTTFDAINDGFQRLFPQVFGGGKAWLELTDDDLLQSGVAIMAQPPGKRNSTIHLLSGGEKALTALSLVFAIFQLNPAPFCLLDEVDAPLDDANVGRFCQLLEQMAKDVQFIYISHNKVTMELAQQLTGVTMQEAGASRIVAVDIEDALAFAEA